MPRPEDVGRDPCAFQHREDDDRKREGRQPPAGDRQEAEDRREPLGVEGRDPVDRRKGDGEDEEEQPGCAESPEAHAVCWVVARPLSCSADQRLSSTMHVIQNAK